MTDSLVFGTKGAHERRSVFGAKAPHVARAAGLPAMRYKKAGFPLPSWARFYHDDSVLAVLVCGGESWRTVEKALAYAVAHAGGRRLELVLPERWQGKTGDALQATRVRAAFLQTDIRLWTHDGDTARRCPPLARAEASGLLGEEALRGGELDLQDLASHVSDLETWAGTEPELSACHEKSHRTWRCQGLILLSVQRRGKGLLVKSGVHYSKATPATPLPGSVSLVDRDLTAEELSEIKARVRDGIKGKLSGHPRGYREHWMQATLARYPAKVGWHGPGRLEREFPAKRPGGGTGYIDFLRLDDDATLHIVETKIGHDEMLVLQGLDYWIWARANAALLASHFKVDKIGRTVIDYVVGTEDGQSTAPSEHALISPYTPAQLEAISQDIDWQVHMCTGWATTSPAITALGARTVPAEPYVHHRT